MSPDLHSDPLEPRPKDRSPSSAPSADRARESLIWDGGVARPAPPRARSDFADASGDAKRCPHCDGVYDAALMFCPRDGAVLRGTANGDDLTGQLLAGRYRVIRKLGEGAMGQVYLAEHLRMGRTCAIKVMSSALLANAAAIARFDREASNASRISHPGVVSVYDFGEANDGIVFLAMEYVDGVPLTKLLEEQRALPVDRALRIARQIAGALSAAHELGIVHRDLKPDNIMIGRNRDGTDCVKVVDFGISKGVQGPSQTLTMTGLIIGTPAYMSPEQLAGDAVDGRSDIYSLGLVLFHMLAGALPFASGEDGVRARLIAPARSLAAVRPDRDWPSALQALLDRTLAPLASNRQPTADAVAADIERLLTEPGPTQSSASGARSVSRSAVLTASGVTIAACLAAGALWFSAGGSTTAGNSGESLHLKGAAPASLTDGSSAADASRIAAPDSTARQPSGPNAAAKGAGEESAESGRVPPADRPQLPPAPSILERSGSTAPAAAQHASESTTTRPSAVLDTLERWTSPTTGTVESSRRAINRLPDMLSRLTSMNDSVAANYYVAGAHIALGDASAACVVLRRIERAGASHPYLSRAITTYLSDPALNCR